MNWTRILIDVARFGGTLALAAVLGASLGLARRARRGIVHTPAHVIQTQILLAIVGAMIMIIVAESLARAFAIVGAAGLIRYRARIKDPKDAGVMLVALGVGLAAGAGLAGFAITASAFVIVALWILETMEPSARARFDLKIATADPAGLQPQVERTLRLHDVEFDLRASSHDELTYEVTVPLSHKIKKISKVIEGLDQASGTLVEWEIKKVKKVKS